MADPFAHERVVLAHPGGKEQRIETAEHGGERTMAIPADSSAVDTGSAETCPDTDQRGIPRPQLEGCDIGAVEYVSIDEDTIFRDSFDVPPVQAPSASTGNHSREVEPVACVISGISSPSPR